MRMAAGLCARMLGADGDLLAAMAERALEVSPSGHYLAFGPETFVLVGDSGTRCVMQDANLE